MSHAANWKSLERHHLSAEYADITGKAWELYLSNLQAVGNVNGRKVVLHEGKVLDGWQFQRACVELDSKPEYEKLPAGADPAVWVSTLNDHRRHESQDKATRRIEQRRERVAAAREEGQSIRTIAEQEGVGVATVHKDLAEVSTVRGRTVEPKDGKVHGKDGYTQTANPVRPPKPEPVLCARCSRNERTGQPAVNGCPMCKEARGGTKKAPKQQPEGEAPKDDYGNEIPKRCRDAFCDPWLRQTFDGISVLSAEFRKARYADGMNKRAKRYPFFNAKDFIDGCGFVIQYLDNLLEHIKQNEPSGVCPSCEGKGCGHCRMSGMVPRSMYKELKAKS